MKLLLLTASSASAKDEPLRSGAFCGRGRRRGRGQREVDGSVRVLDSARARSSTLCGPAELLPLPLAALLAPRAAPRTKWGDEAEERRDDAPEPSRRQWRPWMQREKPYSTVASGGRSKGAVAGEREVDEAA